MFVLDSHCDAPSMLIKGADFAKGVRRGISEGSFPVTHVDYPRMKKGGVDASFFALYTSNTISEEQSLRIVMKMIAAVNDSIAQNPGMVALATSAAQAFENKKKGLLSIFLGLENGAPIGKDLSMLRLFFKMGVRYMTLTHNGHNEICDSAAPAEKRWGGVSPFGREVIAEMNRLGMLIDVAHISDDSFWDVIKYSKEPVVSTHSCCRALCSHSRNMTDDMICAMAEKGGVIQINFYPSFLEEGFAERFNPVLAEFESAYDAYLSNSKDEALQTAALQALDKMNSIKRPSYRRIVDHIDHVVKLAGVEHVGIGSDFDGIEIAPEGLDDISMMPKIIVELRKRGYREAEIALITSGNFLRVLQKIEKR